MAKVAVLVPSQELCNLAQPLVGTFPSITLMTLEYIKTSQAESRARELERQGCDLIVARGVQARIIKQSVKLPVVEISVTLQELASVMLELKSELALPCPRIGLIGQFPDCGDELVFFAFRFAFGKSCFFSFVNTLVSALPFLFNVG